MIFTFIHVSNYGTDDNVFERGPVSMRCREFSVSRPLEVVDCMAPICNPFTSVRPQ